jgi:putative MATE family efflux protein
MSRKTIIRASAPLVIAFLLHSAFNIVDAYFVGQISAEALAAVSASFPVVFLLISLGGGIGIGATSVISRYIGAKEMREANNAAEHALLVSIAIGVLLSIGGLLLSPLIFDLMGVEYLVKKLGLEYLNIILIFSPFMLAGFVGNSILRGEGDMDTPMKVMAMAAILNTVLDPIFIFTFGLGVAGAAYATIVARTLAIAYMLFHIFSGRSWIKLSFNRFRYEGRYLSEIFNVGIPSSLSHLLMSLNMFLLTVICGFFGTEAIAAFGIGFRLDSLALLPGMAISVAVTSIVGQSVGAGDFLRAKKATVQASVLACALMCILGVFFIVFAENISAIFNSDPLVISYASSFMRIIPISYLVVGAAMSISGAFIGAGRAYLSFTATLFRALIFTVPLAYLFSTMYGVEGIWAGIVLGSALGFIVTVVLYSKTNWLSTTS